MIEGPAPADIAGMVALEGVLLRKTRALGVLGRWKVVGKLAGTRCKAAGACAASGARG